MAVIVASVAGASSFQRKGALTARGITPEKRSEIRRLTAGLKSLTAASGAVLDARKITASSNRELRRRWEGLRYIPLSEVVVEAEARLTELSEGAEPDPDQDTTRALVDGVTQELHRLTSDLASEHQHRNREARRRPDGDPQEPAKPFFGADRTADPPRLLLVTGSPVGRHAPPTHPEPIHGLEVRRMAA